ncbi:MAG: tetratricopeptide repeat protein [Synergistaceae bacterium]|jgi:tetratricopeptide (TPR) repeat protein|nr:tetratricopeptide repeat protein [Synergistaceae bacterium]
MFKGFVSSFDILKKITVVALAALCFMTVAELSLREASYANGHSPPDESRQKEETSADQKARREKIEAAKRERERRAAEARRKAEAAKKAAAKKAAAEEAARKKAAEEAERAAQEAERVRRALQQGRDLVEEGRFETALRVLRDFIRAHPRSAEAWYWISRAHHATGDYDNAQIAVNIALEIDPDFPALVKTPSGLQPKPRLTKQGKKLPPPSMSVLPVKPPLPVGLELTPVVISFPILARDGEVVSGDAEYSPEDPDAIDPRTGAYLRYLPYPPLERGRTAAWQQSEPFMEISRWRFRVDRMGILKAPRTPVAWKGSHPYEVYFWTGSEWARARKKVIGFDWTETYDDILNNAKDDIAGILEERGFQWDESDTPSLAASASLMRYYWQGDIDLAEAAKRAGKRAKEQEEYDSWEELDKKTK